MELSVNMAKLIDCFSFMMYLIRRQSAVGPIYTMFMWFKIYISSSLEKKEALTDIDKNKSLTMQL